jgi:hypothetical protein
LPRAKQFPRNAIDCAGTNFRLTTQPFYDSLNEGAAIKSVQRSRNSHHGG